MGSTHSGLTEEDIVEYEDLTYLTSREVIHAWSVWKGLINDPNLDDKTRLFHADQVIKLPELQHNPFNDQLVLLFGERSPLGQPSMNFEHFLDLLNVMSPKAPVTLKAHYAFKIFDFNEDTMLEKEDLSKVLDKLTGQSLEQKSKDFIIRKLLEESDMDSSGSISEEEFKHLLTKCPDFCDSFRFTL